MTPIPTLLSANGTYGFVGTSGTGVYATVTFASSCTAVWAAVGAATNGAAGTSTASGRGGGGGGFATKSYSVTAGEVFNYGNQTGYDPNFTLENPNSAYFAPNSTFLEQPDGEAAPASGVSGGIGYANVAGVTATNGGNGIVGGTGDGGSGGGGNGTAAGNGNNGSAGTTLAGGAGGTDGSGNPGGGAGGAPGVAGSNATNGGGGGGGFGAGLPAKGLGTTAGLIQVVVTGMATPTPPVPPLLINLGNASAELTIAVPASITPNGYGLASCFASIYFENGGIPCETGFTPQIINTGSITYVITGIGHIETGTSG